MRKIVLAGIDGNDDGLWRFRTVVGEQRLSIRSGDIPQEDWDKLELLTIEWWDFFWLTIDQNGIIHSLEYIGAEKPEHTPEGEKITV